MAKSSKRAWKLQEFQSHDGPVNCLSIGHKSGKVLATGGEDKRVNLWAVGKPNCIMNLRGHSTPVESLRFNCTEDLVAAGSQGGVLKIWNLEASKSVLRTLSGHKCNVKALDFHPYGEIIASGSMDTNIKLWDFRRKGCIFTYKGHMNAINSLRFSPDGKWIVSASVDGTARLWDMSTGRQMAEFKHGNSSVTSVEFHPSDFLLITGGVDKTVKFWDLETFQIVSSTDGDCGPIRAIFVHPDGNCVYAACQDYLKVYGWEPATCFDSVNVGWGKPVDIIVHQNELIGATHQQSNVSLYIADLQKIKPLCEDEWSVNNSESTSSPFNKNASRRRSFITKYPAEDVKSPPSALVNTSNCNYEEGDDEDDDDDDEVVVDDDDCKNEAQRRQTFISSAQDYDKVFNPRKELPRDIQSPEKVTTGPQETTYTSSTPITGRPQVNQQTTAPPLPNKPTFQQRTVDPTNAFLRQQQNFLKQNPQYIQKQTTATTITTTPQQVQPAATTTTTTSTAITSSSVVTTSSKPLRRPITTGVNLKAKDSPRNKVVTNPKANVQTNMNVTITTTNAQPKTTATEATTSINKTEEVADNSFENFFRSISTLEENKLAMKKEEINKAKPQTNFSSDSPMVRANDDTLPAKMPPNTSNPPKVTNQSDKCDPPSRGIIEDFIPKQFAEDIGNDQAMNIIGGGHQVVLSVLTSRNRNLQVFKTLRSGGNVKMALDSVVSMNDQAVLHDVVNLLLQNPMEWTLDTCASVLPVVSNLVVGRYEPYTTTGLRATNFILRTFASLIKDTISNVSSIGVDISKEERYNKSMKCYNMLTGIGSELDKRSASFRTPVQNDQIREIKLLLAQLD